MDGFGLIANKSLSERNKILRSQEFLNQMSRMFRGIAGKRVECLFIPEGSEELAYTDGQVTYINPTHRMFNDLDERGTMTALIGLRLHELLHHKYTDNNTLSKIIRINSYEKVKPLLIKKIDELNEGEYESLEPFIVKEISSEEDGYIVVPDSTEEESVDECAYLAIFRQIFKSVWNTIEDGRIERIGTFEFPGVAYSLYFVNKLIVEQRKLDEEKEDLNILHSLIWDKALLNSNKSCPENLVEMWSIIKPLVVKGRMSHVCQECFEVSMLITRLLMSLSPTNDMANKFRKSQERRSKGKEEGTNKPASDPSQISNTGEETMDSSEQGEGNEGANGDSSATFEIGSSSGISSEERSRFQQMIEEGLRSIKRNIKNNEKNKEKDAKEENKYLNNASLKGGFSQFSRSDVILNGDEKAKYYAIANKADNKRIINRFINQMKDILNFNQDEVERYETRGMIDCNCFGNMGSGAIFSRRIAAEEVNELNIFLDIDTSGSMSGYKEGMALETAVILSEVCDALNIRLTIFGFGSAFHIYRFAEGRNKSSKYNIASIKSSGGTPMLPMIKTNEAFCEKDGTDKFNIVFVLTDGEPFNMEATAQAIKKLQKKGIEVFGLGIDCSETSMVELFGNKYIDVTDLSILPKTVCNIVKRNLLKH